IFRSGGTNQGSSNRPGSGLGVWAVVGPLTPTSVDPSGGTGNWNPGVVIRDMASEEIVTFIAVYNSKYIQVRDYLGNIGYAPSEDLEETATAADPIVIPERRIYTQIFRIKTVTCDEANQSVTVSAEHISYDFQANKLFDCQMTEAEPATAVALIQGRLVNDDSRLIACPFEYPLITADWSWKNPIQAVLDPEDGLAGQLRCMVLRDNADIFLLPQQSRVGARLAYGVNLRGVKWSRSIDDLITRIIPRAGDGDGGMLYLDELYIDSTHIDDYAVIRTEVLDSKYSVGQEIEHADGTKQTLSKSDVIERMREECENRYYVDGADKVTVTLDVQFVLLGDTEEFRQYRNLERVNLYDTIAVDTGHMETRAQVIGYEWDSLTGRYNGVSIGKVYAMARKRIPGYRVASGAITYSKLSPGLIKWIKGSET
ncbi:MAG: phage tail protein, partial [Kiritimatiellae bacterium]|nr:phage tail protein [Kiritimatiellia bacterium]